MPSNNSPADELELSLQFPKILVFIILAVITFFQLLSYVISEYGRRKSVRFLFVRPIVSTFGLIFFVLLLLVLDTIQASSEVALVNFIERKQFTVVGVPVPVVLAKQFAWAFLELAVLIFLFLRRSRLQYDLQLRYGTIGIVFFVLIQLLDTLIVAGIITSKNVTALQGVSTGTVIEAFSAVLLTLVALLVSFYGWCFYSDYKMEKDPVDAKTSMFHVIGCISLALSMLTAAVGSLSSLAFSLDSSLFQLISRIFVVVGSISLTVATLKRRTRLSAISKLHLRAKNDVDSAVILGSAAVL